MKKILTVFLTGALLVTMAFSSFAQVSFSNVYTYEDDKTVYLFGKLLGEDSLEDAGVTVGEDDYNLNSEETTKTYQLNKQKQFGIGLKDKTAALGLEFNATPFVLTGGSKVNGDAMLIKRELLENMTSFTVDGKTVPGFCKGTTETDFYYGLDVLPETAAELPTVAASIQGISLNAETAPEYAGYVTTISYTWADGSESTIARLHFRKYSEITKTVTPESLRICYYNYVDYGLSVDLGSSNVYNKNIRNLSEDYTAISQATRNMLAYWVYDVESVAGYAPVSYTLNNVNCGYKSTTLSLADTFSIYNYDGRVDQNIGTVADGQSAQSHPFSGFSGFNMSNEFFVAQKPANVISDSNNYSGMESKTVQEGKNAIIMASDDYTGKYVNFYYFPASTNFAITVKYVEKNPENTDATLSSISVDGTPLSDFDSGKYEYYIATDDELAQHIITGTPTVPGATVAVSGNIINVTSLDGSTVKSYELKFRIPQTINLLACRAYDANYAVARSKDAGSYEVTLCYANAQAIDTGNANLRYGYLEFDVSALNIGAVTSATMEAFVSGIFNEKVVIGNSNYADGDELFGFKGLNKDCKFVDGVASGPNFTALVDITAPSQNKYTISLNASALQIRNGKIFLVFAKETSSGATTVWINHNKYPGEFKIEYLAK